MRYYDRLIFELSRPGRSGYSLPGGGESVNFEGGLWRESSLDLPEVSEVDVVRHYTNLSQMNFGVDTGFYPLGSCTMKYNPKINEEIANMPAFTGLHPLQPTETVKGALEVYAGKKKGWEGLTDATLGYCHIQIDQPVMTDRLTLRMIAPSQGSNRFGNQKELAGGNAGEFDRLRTAEGKVELRIIEVDILESVK